MMKNVEINCFLKQPPQWWPSKGTLFKKETQFMYHKNRSSDLFSSIYCSSELNCSVCHVLGRFW